MSDIVSNIFNLSLCSFKKGDGDRLSFGKVFSLAMLVLITTIAIITLFYSLSEIVSIQLGIPLFFAVTRGLISLNQAIALSVISGGWIILKMVMLAVIALPRPNSARVEEIRTDIQEKVDDQTGSPLKVDVTDPKEVQGSNEVIDEEEEEDEDDENEVPTTPIPSTFLRHYEYNEAHLYDAPIYPSQNSFGALLTPPGTPKTSIPSTPTTPSHSSPLATEHKLDSPTKLENKKNPFGKSPLQTQTSKKKIRAPQVREILDEVKFNEVKERCKEIWKKNEKKKNFFLVFQNSLAKPLDVRTGWGSISISPKQYFAQVFHNQANAIFPQIVAVGPFEKTETISQNVSKMYPGVIEYRGTLHLT